MLPYIIFILADAFLLMAASFFDIKKRIIPNKIVLLMIVVLCFYADFLMLTYPAEDHILLCVMKAVSGVLFTQILLFLPEIITGKCFGAGDKKVFMVLGLSFGPWKTILLMGAAMVSAFIYSLYKKTKKTETIAMAPHILAAYICVVVFYDLLLHLL